MSVTRFGGYADRIVVPDEQVFDIPDGMSFEQAAAFPTVFLTAWYALFELGRPRPGKRALVHSAAGGVGSALLQLCRVAECTPVAVVGRPEKVEAARGKPEIFENFRAGIARKTRGFLAPEYNIRCIEAAVNQPFDEGLATEGRLFLELMTGEQSAAQRYAFFAEREVWKIPDVPRDTPQI